MGRSGLWQVLGLTLDLLRNKGGRHAFSVVSGSYDQSKTDDAGEYETD